MSALAKAVGWSTPGLLTLLTIAAINTAWPPPLPESPATPRIERRIVFSNVNKAERCESSKDCLLLAELAYYEARSERDQGMYAVMWVALNRLKVGHRGARSLREVVYDPYQFSYVHDGSLSQGYREKSQLRRAKQLAYDVLTGIQPDVTDGALYYHTVAVTPHWAGAMEYAFHMDSHIFYR